MVKHSLLLHTAQPTKGGGTWLPSFMGFLFGGMHFRSLDKTAEMVPCLIGIVGRGSHDSPPECYSYGGDAFRGLALGSTEGKSTNMRPVKGVT